MNNKFYTVAGFVIAAVFLSTPYLTAQSIDFLNVRLIPEVSFPVLGDEAFFTTGGGASLAFDFDVLPFVSPSLEAGYFVQPITGNSSLNVANFGAGLILTLYPFSRFGIGLGGIGGMYQASWDSLKVDGYFMKGRAEFSYRFSPSFSLAGGTSYSQLFGTSRSLYQGLGISLTGMINLAGLRGGTNIKLSNVQFDPIFPIFYSYYDKNSLGSFTLENHEAGDIRNVRVSLYFKQFMDQPKLCASFPVLKRGASVDVPVYALFTDQVLKLVESAKTSAEIIVEYSFLDSPRRAAFTETLRMNHRNAMTWDDDRKAAAFVSAKDPAVLRYSKFIAGLIREAGQSEINQNLRFAMGLFEALKLYGVNYVIDPTTPYQDISQDKNALDFLQFPNQTLTYKGGDCDDLSILFCSILESVGIKTAFITIPGHIYMAFALDMSEEEAKFTFSNTSDIMYLEGKSWIPLEITLVNDGFLKAWQVGAKQWYDNKKTEQAAFISIQDAWSKFEPVGIPGEDTRIVLPPPDQILGSYNAALAKFITREIQPKVERIKSDILSSGNNPKQINRLGVLYARYGQLDLAKIEFEKAGKLNFGPALANLGNIAFLQKKYPDAIGYYQRALAQKAEDKTALLGLARTQYELENYLEVDKAFARVQLADPTLANQYSYLVSRADGTARAASAGERIGRAAWNDE